MTNNNNCDSVITLDLTINSSSEIDIFYNQYEIHTYPNPFTNQTTVSFYNPTQSKADVKVIDSRGRIVRNYYGITGESIIIKKEELSEGIYYIQLNFSNNIIRKPIVFCNKNRNKDLGPPKESISFRDSFPFFYI